MILRDLLKDIKGDIRLGAGSAFMYCGSVDLKEIERITRHYKTRYNDARKRARREYTNFDENQDAREEKILYLCPTPHEEEKEPGYYKYYKEYKNEEDLRARVKEDRAKAWENVKRLKLKYDTWHKNYKPLLDREVREVYPSTYENVTIILIDGIEDGDFWDREEYIKKGGANYE